MVGSADGSELKTTFYEEHRLTHGVMPFKRERGGKALEESLGLRTEDAINGHDERGEMLSCLMANSRVFAFLVVFEFGKSGGDRSVEARRSVGVGDTNVKNGICAAGPKVANGKVASEFLGCSVGNEGLEAYLVRGEGVCGEGSNFIAKGVMAMDDQATFVAGEAMSDGEGLTTAITCGR